MLQPTVSCRQMNQFFDTKQQLLLLLLMLTLTHQDISSSCHINRSNEKIHQTSMIWLSYKSLWAIRCDGSILSCYNANCLKFRLLLDNLQKNKKPGYMFYACIHKIKKGLVSQLISFNMLNRNCFLSLYRQHIYFYFKTK